MPSLLKTYGEEWEQTKQNIRFLRENLTYVNLLEVITEILSSNQKWPTSLKHWTLLHGY